MEIQKKITKTDSQLISTIKKELTEGKSISSEITQNKDEMKFNFQR
jgi:hypothetical protein